MSNFQNNIFSLELHSFCVCVLQLQYLQIFYVQHLVVSHRLDLALEDQPPEPEGSCSQCWNSCVKSGLNAACSIPFVLLRLFGLQVNQGKNTLQVSYSSFNVSNKARGSLSLSAGIRLLTVVFNAHNPRINFRGGFLTSQQSGFGLALGNSILAIRVNVHATKFAFQALSGMP